MSEQKYEESDYQKVLDDIVSVIKDKTDKQNKFSVLINELVEVNTELDLLKNNILFNMIQTIIEKEDNNLDILEYITINNLRKIINAAITIKPDFKLNECECNVCDYKNASGDTNSICKFCTKEIPCAMQDTQYYCTHDKPKIVMEQNEKTKEVSFILFCSQKCSLDYAEKEWKMTHL